VVLLVGGALLGQARPDLPILGNPAQSGLLIAVIVVFTLEALRLRGSECPYLEKSALFRIPFHLASTVVLLGIAVLAVLARSVLSLATVGLLLLSIGSAVSLHVRVDHSPSEFGAAPIWLVSVFRLAFIFFLGSAVLLVVRAIRAP
jgi:hypothetical protein